MGLWKVEFSFESIMNLGILQCPLPEASYADQHSRTQGEDSAHLQEPGLHCQRLLQAHFSGILYVHEQTHKLSNFFLQKKKYFIKGHLSYHQVWCWLAITSGSVEPVWCTMDRSASQLVPSTR